jgi:putative Mn2+ efflux pump MntP
MIGRMMMTLTGLILGMLGLITAIHSDHFVLGVLLLFGGVWSMHEGLPSYDQNERLRRYERQHQQWLKGGRNAK